MVVCYSNPDQSTGLQAFGAPDETKYRVGASFPFGEHLYTIVSTPRRGIDLSDGITKTFLCFEAKKANPSV